MVTNDCILHTHFLFGKFSMTGGMPVEFELARPDYGYVTMGIFVLFRLFQKRMNRNGTLL